MDKAPFERANCTSSSWPTSMFALPILARELRSRARKPWTAWMRVLVGLFATLMAASTLSWTLQRTGLLWLPGKFLFESLTATLFVFCLVEGVRQTADCLSQEKREGTLGLLFLTELSGMDVVLGKLAATSLGSFFALLATFPVMAVALVAGGVTAGEFWRTVLVLLNTLFAGLAWGMWASARHQVEGRGLLVGLGTAFAFALVPWIFELFLRPTGLPNFSLSVALHLADDAVYFTAPSRYWATLVLAHALSWVLLLAAGRTVESSWREGAPLVAVPAESAAESSRTGDDVNDPPATIQEYGPVRMEDDPACWLARRQLRHVHVIWISLVTLGIGPYLSMLLPMLLPGVQLFGLYRAINLASDFLPLALLLFIMSRSFAEARRGGEMELLLSTPLSAREIVLGQWRALWQRLRKPFIVTASIVGFVTIVILLGGASPFLMFSQMGFGFIYTAECAKRLLCGLAACWLGLYLGLRTESVLRAVGYGLLWLVVGPWLCSSVFWFLVRSLISGSISGGMPPLFWIALLLPVIFGCLYFAGILWWCRRELIGKLRQLAARN